MRYLAHEVRSKLGLPAYLYIESVQQYDAEQKVIVANALIESAVAPGYPVAMQGRGRWLG